MSIVDPSSAWQDLLAEVPRAPFIPDTIWVDGESGDGFVALSKHSDPDGWHAVVSADAPVITQVNLGDVQPGQKGRFPSSSCSQPSIVAEMLNALDVRPGHSVLEIGTGTGWNAAILSHRVGEHGRVITVEVDPSLAEDARRALAGYHPLVITADGLAGYPPTAPYDRVISTASVRERVPQAWLDHLRPGGRLVTPWGTDWSNGVMLTVHQGEGGAATGRFSGDLAFMRIRSQRRALYGWEPEASDIEHAQINTTECRGADLDRMLNSDKGTFAIGARLASCCLIVEWDKHGERHHTLELDDAATKSWSQLDANLNDPAPFTVRQRASRCRRELTRGVQACLGSCSSLMRCGLEHGRRCARSASATRSSGNEHVTHGGSHLGRSSVSIPRRAMRTDMGYDVAGSVTLQSPRRGNEDVGMDVLRRLGVVRLQSLVGAMRTDTPRAAMPATPSGCNPS